MEEFADAGDYALGLALAHNVLDEAKANAGRKFGERGVRLNRSKLRLARIRGEILAMQCRAGSALSNFKGEEVVLEAYGRHGEVFLGTENALVQRLEVELVQLQTGEFKHLECFEGQYLEIGEVNWPSADGGKAMACIKQGDEYSFHFVYEQGEELAVSSIEPAWLSKGTALEVLVLLA